MSHSSANLTGDLLLFEYEGGVVSSALGLSVFEPELPPVRFDQVGRHLELLVWSEPVLVYTPALAVVVLYRRGVVALPLLAGVDVDGQLVIVLGVGSEVHSLIFQNIITSKDLK